jgi:CRP-like cAMP-binding protein
VSTRVARQTRSSRPEYLPPVLWTLGHQVSCPKDGWVFRKGDPVRAVFLVLDGEVRLSRFAKDGSEIALHRAGRGEFFAEAALSSTRYRCNAIASQPSTLLEFPAAKVRTLLANDHEFSRQWIGLLARQLHALRARLERQALKSAADRVLHLLLTEGSGQHCEVVLPGSVKDLAKELGLTHESLYRTLARMERDGVVVRGENRLRMA